MSVKRKKRRKGKGEVREKKKCGVEHREHRQGGAEHRLKVDLGAREDPDRDAITSEPKHRNQGKKSSFDGGLKLREHIRGCLLASRLKLTEQI